MATPAYRRASVQTSFCGHSCFVFFLSSPHETMLNLLGRQESGDGAECIKRRGGRLQHLHPQLRTPSLLFPHSLHFRGLQPWSNSSRSPPSPCWPWHPPPRSPSSLPPKSAPASSSAAAAAAPAASRSWSSSRAARPSWAEWAKSPAPLSRWR
ncbi:hypothetical protein MPH_02867 [Macrophomina phaseolina MS6]|uniref:Uncharacterized protein n=1 Tax=Macrophomina phaseolina (strain MS6) TaxID=1126212 RepID=K2RYF3_MACPH|nr:hypothetical protein MPH_02867 [Macrophomina phaseolina MS6]